MNMSNEPDQAGPAQPEPHAGSSSILFKRSFDLNWQALEDHLFEQSELIIHRFAIEHPDVICSFFAFDTEPLSGNFTFSFDTYENSLQSAKQQEQDTIDRRNQLLRGDTSLLRGDTSWKYAQHFIRTVTDYGSDINDFAYPAYKSLFFKEMERFVLRGDDQHAGQSEEYLYGNTRIIVWSVVERLIASEALNQLRLASPFRVGYQIYNFSFTVLRILNWPSTEVH